MAVNADVIGRNLFNHPIPGVLEFLGLSIVAIVFLQMANTLREGRHVSNDLLTQLVADARPRLSLALYALVQSDRRAADGAHRRLFVWPIFVSNYDGGYYRGTDRRRRDSDLAVHGRRPDRRRRPPPSSSCSWRGIQPGAPCAAPDHAS